MHLQKGLFYLCTKKFLLPLLHFWNYNPSPNGQIIFFTGAQAHLQTHLVWSEWCKVLKIIHCRISPTQQIEEEEAKLQSYILSLKKISYFYVFFRERSSFIFYLRCHIIFSGKRSMIFPDNKRKIIFPRDFFGKIIFSGRLEKENMAFRAVTVT